MEHKGHKWVRLCKSQRHRKCSQTEEVQLNDLSSATYLERYLAEIKWPSCPHTTNLRGKVLFLKRTSHTLCSVLRKLPISLWRVEAEPLESPCGFCLKKKKASPPFFFLQIWTPLKCVDLKKILVWQLWYLSKKDRREKIGKKLSGRVWAWIKTYSQDSEVKFRNLVPLTHLLPEAWKYREVYSFNPEHLATHTRNPYSDSCFCLPVWPQSRTHSSIWASG